MTTIVANPFYDSFMSLCAKSERRIRLCAPYTKSEIFTDLLSVKRNDVSIELITKINLRDYHSEASDLDVVRQALLNGGRVFNCSNLHAKVYIFDDSQCMI